ncbi:MAG: hypothetical protein SLAVMIC_00043 [uncultured marine phage]|uniref:Uncharacterized protein n=1 Tax=uncultured marine phage TaxID=707152 RepID=A0A8D9FPW7_9VIRU|nr:MAG: hypothetical protein SLAVMIC_00043 [uncultured marine phage]
MSKFKIGDRVIVDGAKKISPFKKVFVNEKAEIVKYHGSKICKLKTSDGTEWFIDISFVRIDKQYYREERFKKILGEI